MYQQLECWVALNTPYTQAEEQNNRPPPINSALDDALWPDSRSGHFTPIMNQYTSGLQVL